MSASLIEILDELGTADDELVTLREAAEHSPYSTKYLALRCKQGMLPAARRTGKKWLTSRRSLSLYGKHSGRRK